MLVDYSDSDASDTEQPPPPPPKPTGLAALLPKPKTRRNRDVAPNDGPKKIVVNLPQIEDEELELPPAKKARVGGGGSGLSAMLPAPKRRGGASVAPEVKNAETETEKKEDAEEKGEVEETEKPKAEPKQTSSTMFVPQSVARKPIQPMSAFRKKGKGGGTAVGGGPQAKEKPKISLFGSGTTVVSSATQKSSVVTTAAEYKPIMLEAAQPARKPVEEEEGFGDASFEDGKASAGQVAYAEETTYQQPINNVDVLAQDIGLDETAMRQLYGRRGRGKEPITFSNFSVDDEYRQNELERALGLAEDIKPVRAIQPGKHQLRTLLTAAQSQRSALEDSFAQGKKNRKEAGSKYGWG